MFGGPNQKNVFSLFGNNRNSQKNNVFGQFGNKQNVNQNQKNNNVFGIFNGLNSKKTKSKSEK